MSISREFRDAYGVRDIDEKRAAEQKAAARKCWLASNYLQAVVVLPIEDGLLQLTLWSGKKAFPHPFVGTPAQLLALADDIQKSIQQLTHTES